jgi:hypothetical protein
LGSASFESPAGLVCVYYDIENTHQCLGVIPNCVK